MHAWIHARSYGTPRPVHGDDAAHDIASMCGHPALPLEMLAVGGGSASAAVLAGARNADDRLGGGAAVIVEARHADDRLGSRS